jgi:hypothetical protein
MRKSVNTILNSYAMFKDGIDNISWKNKAVKEISETWNVEVDTTDLQNFYTTEEYPSRDGTEIFKEVTVHFVSTKSLIEKLSEYPEALI